MKIKYLSVTREGARLSMQFQETVSGKVHPQVVWHPDEESAARQEQLILNNIWKHRK